MGNPLGANLNKKSPLLAALTVADGEVVQPSCYTEGFEPCPCVELHPTPLPQGKSWFLMKNQKNAK